MPIRPWCSIRWTKLEQLAGRIAGGGFELSWADRDTFDGYVRFHCRDAFGNRVEVLAPADAGVPERIVGS